MKDMQDPMYITNDILNANMNIKHGNTVNVLIMNYELYNILYSAKKIFE